MELRATRPCYYFDYLVILYLLKVSENLQEFWNVVFRRLVNVNNTVANVPIADNVLIELFIVLIHNYGSLLLS